MSRLDHRLAGKLPTKAVALAMVLFASISSYMAGQSPSPNFTFVAGCCTGVALIVTWMLWDRADKAMRLWRTTSQDSDATRDDAIDALEAEHDLHEGEL